MSRPPSKRRRITPSQDDMKTMMKEAMKELMPTIVEEVTENLRCGNQPGSSVEVTPADPTNLEIANPSTSGTCSNMDNTQANNVRTGPMHVGRRAGHNIDPKIRAKIISEEYVQLPSLLFKSNQTRLEAVQGSDNQISFVQKEQKLYFKNFNQWVDAFHVFVAIYCTSFPDQSPNLMRYMQIVQKLANDVGEKAALYYDEQFRMWRAENPAIMPWNVINQELHSEAIQIGVKARFDASKPKTYKPQLFRAKGESKSGKTGFCFSYNNNNGTCNRTHCRYPHICSKCSKEHPRHLCTAPDDGKKQAPSMPNKQPTAKFITKK